MYDKDTYIPVRISTPAIVIQRIKEKLGIEIPNYPLIMSVDKVINAMERKGVGDDGLPNRLYEKKKDFPQRTSGITVPSVLNDPSFFIDSLHQNEPAVNTSEEKILSKEDQDLLFDDEFYESWRYESKEKIVEKVDAHTMFKE